MESRYALNPSQYAALGDCLAVGGEVAERARLVSALHQYGRVTTVAEICHCDPRVVRKWFGRFLKEGSKGLEDRKRSGRPRRLDDAGLTTLLEEIDHTHKPLTLRKLSKQTNLPTSTIHRSLSLVGLSLHASVRPLWQELGNPSGGWAELCGIAVTGHEQLALFRHHPTMSANDLKEHHQRGGLGCCRHGLIGDSVRLFEVQDREHAILRDDVHEPFATARSWLEGLMSTPSESSGHLHCLAWRPHGETFRDIRKVSDQNPHVTLHEIRNRRSWAQLVDPFFLYERQGSTRVKPVSRCWWRLTDAAIRTLPCIQWTPGKPQKAKRFTHYSGEYYSPEAKPNTDVNDLFESLVVTKREDAAQRTALWSKGEWESPLLGPTTTTDTST